MSIDLSIISVPSYSTLLQIAFLTVLTYIVYRRSRRRKQHEYTEEEKQKLIDDWHPQPLAEPIDPSHYALHPKYVQGYVRGIGRSGLYLRVCVQQARPLSAHRGSRVSECGDDGFPRIGR